MPRIAAHGAMVRRPPPGAPEQHSSEAMHVPTSRTREMCLTPRAPTHRPQDHSSFFFFSHWLSSLSL